MRWLLVVWLIGCRYREPQITGDDAAPVIPDAPPDASCRSTCQDDTTLLDCATGQPVTCPLGCHADVGGDRCAEPVPSNGAGTSDLQGVTGDLIIAHDAVLETATGGIVERGTGKVIRTPGTGVSPEGLAFTLLGTDRGVIGARRMVVANGATLAVAGPRVAIVLAAGDITIEGVVDASGGLVSCTAGTLLQCPGSGGGRGGDSTQDGSGCSPGKKGSNSGGQDKTGGGGGGYGSPAGGNGGTGGDGNAGGAGGGGGCSMQSLVPIAGGSGGGGGGGGGAGGGGGGAIQLTALGNLFVRTPAGGSRAGIEANGAGGQHGGNGSGGGGGGSSGGVLLEGQSVTIQDATLAANAGSGGAGDGGTDGNPGRFDDQRAAGGTGGLAGGFGAARSGTPTAGTGGGNGTGGGGGGIGRIFVNAGASYYQVIGTSLVSPVEYSGVPASM